MSQFGQSEHGSAAPQRRDPARMAFEILVREHHRSLLAYAQALLAGAQRYDANVADDLVQDAFVIAFENLHRFDPNQDFAAWTRGIIRNRFLKLFRNKEMAFEEAALVGLEQVFARWAAPMPGVGAAREDQERETLASLQNCMDGLSEHMRRAIDAFYLQKQSVSAIAQQEAASEAAVKKRLQRGRGLLADCMDRTQRGVES